jgi:hypothetical protein
VLAIGAAEVHQGGAAVLQGLQEHGRDGLVQGSALRFL